MEIIARAALDYFWYLTLVCLLEKHLITQKHKSRYIFLNKVICSYNFFFFPEIQNQPALEKDRYKIRQAFIAAPGNSLIVADYGQVITGVLLKYSALFGVRSVIILRRFTV